MVKETSKLPSVRALIELKARYLSAIYDKERQDKSKIESHINSIHNKVAAASIKKYIDAINSVDAPYRVVIKDTCKIKSSYRATLNFELEFDPVKNDEAFSDSGSIADITTARNKDIARLEKWFENCLYLVASKNPSIPKFK
jgi:hypothetical protein